ncbi:flagellar hook-length control protein FliK [Roseibium polysiphoniae]|uniref:Flagellar hook-length control protein FliK n=1 Tax=Roseibium polysiphoniae TaxID=2571221 RepID=A0ABR9C810_9HYPH|nr:flagellar hook-length control protein FliK [Roseibium polysiphoniae]MBD8876030.1 flagellar hook-length control protein FliK [Roseibium polysiphoniae]
MLPIGMFTDVSAGALDSAAGVVPFSGAKEVAGAFRSFLAEGEGNASPETASLASSLEGRPAPADGQSAGVVGGKSFGEQALGPELSALLGEGDAPVAGEIDSAAVPEDVALNEEERADIAPEDPVFSADVPRVGEELLQGPPAAALGGAVVPSSVSVARSGDAADGRRVGLVGADAAGAGALGTNQSASGDAGAQRPGLASSAGQVSTSTSGDSGKGSSLPAQAERVAVSPDGRLVNEREGRVDSVSSATALKDQIARQGNGSTRFEAGNGSLSSAEGKSDVPAAARASASAASAAAGDEPLSAGKPAELQTAAAVATEPVARRWKTDLPEISRASKASQAVAGAVSPQPKSASSAAASDPVIVPAALVEDGALAEVDLRASGEVSKAAGQTNANVNEMIAAGSPAPKALGAETAVAGNGSASASASDEMAQVFDVEAGFDESGRDLSARQQVGETRADSATRANGAPPPAGNTPESGVSGATAQSSAALATAAAGTLGLEQEAGGDEELDLAFDVKSFAKGELTGSTRADSAQATSRMTNNPVAAQVAGAIARNLQDGHTRFQMRFDPPELGRVDVNMKMAADGSVQAHLIVERPETLDMFMRDQRSLERALEAAGLNADSESLQFSLKQEGEQGFASSQGDDGGFPEGRGDNEEAATAEDAATEQVTQIYLANNTSGLDIRI